MKRAPADTTLRKPRITIANNVYGQRYSPSFSKSARALLKRATWLSVRTTLTLVSTDLGASTGLTSPSPFTGVMAWKIFAIWDTLEPTILPPLLPFFSSICTEKTVVSQAKHWTSKCSLNINQKKEWTALTCFILQSFVFNLEHQQKTIIKTIQTTKIYSFNDDFTSHVNLNRTWCVQN